MKTFNTFKEKVSLSPTGTGWVKKQLRSVPANGRFTRATTRMDTGGLATAADIIVYVGPYDGTTDPSTVPDEDIVYKELAVALTASATASSSEQDLGNFMGSDYCISTVVANNEFKDETIWCAVNVTAATGAAELIVALRGRS